MNARGQKARRSRKPDVDGVTKRFHDTGKGSRGPKSRLTETHSAIDYKRVDELLNLYSRIDQAAMTLPIVTAMPALKFFLNYLVFFFALIGDVLLIVPINVVVFIRNLFPGRWSYKSFSWPYLKAIATWVWRGEFYIPSVSVRPLTVGLLHWHFRSRLATLRRRVLIESGFSGDSANAAIAKIDRAMELWRPHNTLTNVLLTWIMPLAGPFTWAWNHFFPFSFSFSPAWTRFTIVFSLSYLFAVLATSFMAKRGLMLGAKEQAAHYPGFLPGTGAYAQEKETLRAFGVEASEFPLDVILVLSMFLLGFLQALDMQSQVLALMSINLTMDESARQLAEKFGAEMSGRFFYQNLVYCILWIPVMLVALYRRKKLGRA